jgi:orotidine-5'-phosphate decarboxylase
MPEEFEPIVQQLGGTGLGAVKLGFQVGYGIGLPRAVSMVREADSELPIIFDHQKAGNDIPDTGKNFAKVMEYAGVDAAILFPFTGDDVEERWIQELQEREIGVIVGAEMTHKGITSRIREGAFTEIFMQAFEHGVHDFVVPGNKPERVAHWRTLLDKEIGPGNYDLYAPGFVAQGGEISEAGAVAGPRFHAIVGRGIHGAEDPAAAVRGMVSSLEAAQ